MEHSLYLNENQKIKLSPIVINNISINFATAYGMRAVIVAYKNAEHTADNGEAEEQAQSSMKKWKTYGVSVVMQKTTFQGLKNIVKSVNVHLSQLVSIVGTVNVRVKYLISEIELKLPTSYVDCEIIRFTVKSNYQEIERNVQIQISNLAFLYVYYNIVFEELLSLRFNEIVRTILLKRNS